MDDLLYHSKLIGNTSNSLLDSQKQINSRPLKPMVYSREEIMSLSPDRTLYSHIRSILSYHPERAGLLVNDCMYNHNHLLGKRTGPGGAQVFSEINTDVDAAAPLYGDNNLSSPTMAQNELRLDNTWNRVGSPQHNASMLRSHFSLAPVVNRTMLDDCTQLAVQGTIYSKLPTTKAIDYMSSLTDNITPKKCFEHKIYDDSGTEFENGTDELEESVSSDTEAVDQDLICLVNQLCLNKVKPVVFSSSNTDSTIDYKKLAKEKMREHASITLLSRFSGTGSSFPFSTLSNAERCLVDFNSNIFDVQTEFPGMEYVLLKCQTSADLIESSPKGNLRSVVEADLLWMTKALSVASKEEEGYHVCSVLAFIPPRCFLFSDSKGNRATARWNAIAELLEVHYAANPSVPGDIEIRPGLECAARSECGEYIRVVIIGQGTSPTSFRCAALDYHAMVEIEYDWFMALPHSLSTTFLPANTFLGRIRGIQYVPLEHQSCVGTLLNQSSDEDETILSPCAIFGTDPIDDICVVDVVSVNQNDWWSDVLILDGLAIGLPTDPVQPDAREAYEACEEILTAHSDIEWDGNLGLVMNTQTNEENGNFEGSSCHSGTIESEVELDVEVEVQNGVSAENNEAKEAKNITSPELFHEKLDAECPTVESTRMTDVFFQVKEFVDKGTVTENQNDAVLISLDVLSRFISRLPRNTSTNSAIIKLILGLLELLAVNFTDSVEVEADLDECRHHLNSLL